MAQQKQIEALSALWGNIASTIEKGIPLPKEIEIKSFPEGVALSPAAMLVYCCGKILSLNERNAEVWNKLGSNLPKCNLPHMGRSLEYITSEFKTLIPRPRSTSDHGLAAHCFGRALSINDKDIGTWKNLKSAIMRKASFSDLPEELKTKLPVLVGKHAEIAYCDSKILNLDDTNVSAWKSLTGRIQGALGSDAMGVSFEDLAPEFKAKLPALATKDALIVYVLSRVLSLDDTDPVTWKDFGIAIKRSSSFDNVSPEFKVKFPDVAIKMNLQGQIAYCISKALSRVAIGFVIWESLSDAIEQGASHEDIAPELKAKFPALATKTTKEALMAYCLSTCLSCFPVENRNSGTWYKLAILICKPAVSFDDLAPELGVPRLASRVALFAYFVSQALFSKNQNRVVLWQHLSRAFLHGAGIGDVCENAQKLLRPLLLSPLHNHGPANLELACICMKQAISNSSGETKTHLEKVLAALEGKLQPTTQAPKRNLGDEERSQPPQAKRMRMEPDHGRDPSQGQGLFSPRQEVVPELDLPEIAQEITPGPSEVLAYLAEVKSEPPSFHFS